MMGMEPAGLILLAEAVVVMMGLCLILGLVWRRRRRQEQSELKHFIDRLDEATPIGNKALSDWLGRCGMEPSGIENLLADVNLSERLLYQRIVELLLQRDMSVLQALEQAIAQLPEPYLRAMETLSYARQPRTTLLPVAQDPMASLERVNDQLRHQLDIALQTIDDMTTEYTRVFSGQQTALELENSHKRIVQIFQETEQQLRQQNRSFQDEL
ncbi:MAG: hypothetical protein RL563_2112 [Pseudomonadota bacterium]|jgi:hypothetical protein